MKIIEKKLYATQVAVDLIATQSGGSNFINVYFELSIKKKQCTFNSIIIIYYDHFFLLHMSHEYAIDIYAEVSEKVKVCSYKAISDSMENAKINICIVLCIILN